LQTRFDADDRLMDTTQTVRERSRNISRSLQGHDPLKTEDGEVFYKSKYVVGDVGSKVECDRIDEGAQPRFQNCQPWN
jgi:hypothetical protein